ncbi:MAG: hypothetical protein IPM74_19580 [Crocinitomicaceae bacterium]|nr:hypothetical protein [Crocinitomicaceae bacterium]MBK8928035.1 hypothetical protein [Crocinitomicaceae bacterium]
MKNEIIKKGLVIAGAYLLFACSQGNSSDANSNSDTLTQTEDNVNSQPHNFVGWYCPDNLNGLPAVDIADWKNVPVINGRMPTEEETQNGASLVYVDPAEYPTATVLGITMPKLATYFNPNSGREDFIIVIQAFTIDADSIVGFRFLNGGNGTALISDVKFLSDDEISKIPASRFVSFDIEINASASFIQKVLTETEYASKLQRTFDEKNQLQPNWIEGKNVNYNYPESGTLTAKYADILFGNFYVQNDYTDYTEKFLLLENGETKTTTLKIVCGPFRSDYETQKIILNNWAEKVKELSEN